MKTRKTSHILALVVAIAMMLGLATTAFAATTAKLKIGGTDYAGKTYALKVGDVITVDSVIFDGADDKTESTTTSVKWELSYTDKDGAPASADAYAKLAYVAGTDYKEVKITALSAPAEGTLKLVATPALNDTDGDPAEITLTITDGRNDLSALLAGTGTAVAFKEAPKDAIALAKSQITYNVLQAVYNLEDAVDFTYNNVTFTIDGLNMSSFTAAQLSDVTSIMDFDFSTDYPSRTVRTAIAEASKAYGQNFDVAIASDADDRDYYVLDLSNVTIPDEVGSMTVTVDTEALYGTDALGDAAFDDELYMYAYADGKFTLYQTLETTSRTGNDVAFEMEDGDQAYYILTSSKLVKAAASSSSSTLSSSSTPSSSEDIPNTGDANVFAIASMMAVIALAGAALVAKKAVK